MLSWLVGAAVFLFMLWLSHWQLAMNKRRPVAWWRLLISVLIMVVPLIFDLFEHANILTDLAAILIMVVWLYIAWKNRPRGKGKAALGLVGAKTRALRDKLIAAMPKVSPVSRPVLP